MANHYEVLGLRSSASAQEIRRAYRILARRYHPDLNPGKASEDRFKAIANAYQTLSDSDKRKAFDLDLESSTNISAGFEAYRRAQERHGSARAKTYRPPPHYTAPPTPSPTQSQANGPHRSFFSKLAEVAQTVTSELRREKQRAQRKQRPPKTEAPKEKTRTAQVSSVSIVEVSLSLTEAILGSKKSVEVGDALSKRKYSLNIPPGTKNGSLIRMKNSLAPNEELVAIVRVASHPFIAMQNKGLVIEIPLTVAEAVQGTQLTVPTMQGQEKLSVPPGTQSGTELRLSGKGIATIEGVRGDLFYRVLVQVPTCFQAVGIQEKSEALNPYYEGAVRPSVPKDLTEWL